MFEWLMPVFIAFSMSANTPNQGDYAPDYLVQFEFGKTDTLYIARSWERELGTKYKGQEYWIAQTFFNFIYVKGRYIEQLSNALHFFQIDARLKYSIFSIGYANKVDWYLRKFDWRYYTRDMQHRLIAGLNYRTSLSETVDFSLNAEGTTRFEGIVDYYGKTQFDFKINGNVKFFVAGDIVENNLIQNWAIRAGLKVDIK